LAALANIRCALQKIVAFSALSHVATRIMSGHTHLLRPNDSAIQCKLLKHINSFASPVFCWLCYDFELLVARAFGAMRSGKQLCEKIEPASALMNNSPKKLLC
jgi:hypothetical protein